MQNLIGRQTRQEQSYFMRGAVHVKFSDGQWQVKKENAATSASFLRKLDALEAAKKMTAPKGILVVHGRNGQILRGTAYGQDPHFGKLFKVVSEIASAGRAAAH